MLPDHPTSSNDRVRQEQPFKREPWNGGKWGDSRPNHISAMAAFG